MPSPSQTGRTSDVPMTLTSGSSGSVSARATDFRSRKSPPNARTIKSPPCTGTITRADARNAVLAIMRARA